MPFVDLATNQQNNTQKVNDQVNADSAASNLPADSDLSQPVQPPVSLDGGNQQPQFAAPTDQTKESETVSGGLYPPLNQTTQQAESPSMDADISSPLPDIKDPVSKESGLLQQAYMDPSEPVDHNEVVDSDGTRVVSKPFIQQPDSKVEMMQDSQSFTPTANELIVKQPEQQLSTETSMSSERTGTQAEINTTIEKQSPLPYEQSQQNESTVLSNPSKMVENQPVEPQVTNEIEIDQNVLNPNTAQLQDYINLAVSKDASDIHFSVGYPVHLRLDGRLENIGQNPVTDEHIERMLLPILSEEQQKVLKEENIEADFMHVDPQSNRFRVNIFRERGHLAGAFRQIPKTVRTIDELGLPPILKEFSKVPYGLVLVTGPTGSGKSTTIAAMIEEINRTEPRHVVSIEDPVEYIYEPKVALIAQRNMFNDTTSWKAALRAVLRQDPDVVVIGEMRDYETIASALTIAETGHLVFATLHTNNAAQSVDRIIDVFPEGQQNQVRSQLSSMLSGIISQRLVPLRTGGRKAAMEILIGTPAVKNAIREGKTHQINNIIQTSADVGMVSIEKALVDLIRNGDIDIETAKNFTTKPDEIDLLLR